MQREELEATFNKQAAGYDTQWAKMAPIRDAMYYVLEAVLADLPPGARILCVGVGTGAELAHLARKFPGWTFTVVEPAERMLEGCRQRAQREGFDSRCVFHHGYLESLPLVESHDAATCFLVSQFLLDQNVRSGFFSEIANKLRPEGFVASADLASDDGSEGLEPLLKPWATMMTAGEEVSAERLAQMRTAYSSDVAVLPAAKVASIIQAGGFQPPVQFFQAGLLHAWISRRALDHAN